MNESFTHLEGVLWGNLKEGEPLPACFLVRNRRLQESLSPGNFIRYGDLLTWLREKPEDEEKVLGDAQMFFGDQLTRALFLSQVRFDFFIHDGAGHCGTSLEVIQTMQEIQHRRGHVSTYVKEKAISAGAYIWMEGNERYVDPNATFYWHTTVTSPEGKAADLQIMWAFFSRANEAMRGTFLEAIAKDDKGCHELTTTGAALIRAGLAKPIG